VTKPRAEETPEELTEQELEGTNGEPLPDREVMSLIRGAEPLPILIDGGDETIPIDDPHPET
jgi:hypothetical protein